MGTSFIKESMVWQDSCIDSKHRMSILYLQIDGGPYIDLTFMIG
jgi:hypothetical protein